MGLIDDDGKPPVSLFVSYFIEDERKLLYSGDNDLLAAPDEPAQVTGVLCMPYHRVYLCKMPYCIPDLCVENAPVGDDND